MLFVWFIYGLAFFVLGLLILVYPKKGSVFKLANYIWLIASFGILHGINEWIDMFIVLGEPFPPEILKVIRIGTLVGSFLFLLRFGTQVVSESVRKHSSLLVVPVVLFVAWALAVAVSIQRLLTADVLARYLLCAPGALLTAIALFLQVPRFEQTKVSAATRNLRVAAVAFAFYTVFAGLIVKKTWFFPASILNYDSFQAVMHVPVQVFRALCAVVLAYSVTKLLSIFRWETEEALRRSEQRCSTIASAAPIILFVLDRNSLVTFIQGKGLDLIGLEADKIIRRPISEAFPSVPQLNEDSRRALSGEEFVSTVTIGGTFFECCYSPLRDKDGEVTGVIGVALDVTVMLKAQQELDKHRREMERTSRMVEIGTMASAMADELDEPLAVTRLLLQRVLGNLSASSNVETVTTELEKSLAEVSKAVEIVDRFRSVAQLPGSKVMAPVDIYQIARRVITVFAQSAKRANLTITLKGMDFVPFMSMTARELEQIFFIMIQNAIDAGDSDVRRKLVISCRAEDKAIELSFADTCGGIEPERLKHIFEPFFAAQHGGKETGFGLAIARQIIAAHGGNMEADSRPGHGTTFCVTLPAKQIY